MGDFGEKRNPLFGGGGAVCGCAGGGRFFRGEDGGGAACGHAGTSRFFRGEDAGGAACGHAGTGHFFRGEDAGGAAMGKPLDRVSPRKNLPLEAFCSPS
ncbi:MAG: hypothetical protein DBX66_00605 [Clostridiales bacterium]|nr:MAG: hypothetical protein DBX66_00605 [Clostridiales bacterium]